MKSTCVFWLCLTAKLRESCRFDLSQRDYWLDSKLDGASKIMMEGLQNLFCTRDKTFNGLYWSKLLLSCFVQFSKPSHDIVMWRAIYICEYIVFTVSILIWRVFLNHCSKSLKTQRSTLYVVLQTVRLFSLNKNALWILAVLIAKRLRACKWLYNIWQLRRKNR